MQSSHNSINTAVIGLGYWGPNIVRNLAENPGMTLVTCCDLDQKKVAAITRKYPHSSGTTDFRELVTSTTVDAVVIATNPSSHCTLARTALLNGKDVFIEKPMTRTSREAEDLIELAEQKNRILMVGHIYEYAAPVREIEKMVSRRECGDIIHIHSVRANLGLFQTDVNVIWDLAPHDFSILNRLFPGQPCRMSTTARSYKNNGVEDSAFITMQYDSGILVNIHVSWVTPKKIRKMHIVGTKKMIVYNDAGVTEPLTLYTQKKDKPEEHDSFGEFQVSCQYSDCILPRLPQAEPLKVELNHFAACIRDRSQPESDGLSGYRVVRMIETADRSLKKDGRFIRIDR